MRRTAIDMTQGALAPKLVRLAGPLMTANILQTVYNLVDMFWVGRLGATAVAAVAIVFPTQWLLISMAMGVTIAGAALVSQWTGAGDPDRANFSAAQTVTLAVLVATLLAVIAYMSRFLLLRLLGATGPLYQPTLDYVSIIFWTVPFTFVFIAYSSVMRGAGETVRPMYVTIGTIILNMVLDPLLILGIGPFPAMGVAGAAWATLYSRAVAAAIGLWLLFNGREAVVIRVHQLMPDWPTIRQLLRVGIPGGLDGAARSFSAVAMIAIVTRFGPIPTAAYGIGVRVMSLVWTVSSGMAQSVATGVGQNLGADQPARGKAGRVDRHGHHLFARGRRRTDRHPVRSGYRRHLCGRRRGDRRGHAVLAHQRMGFWLRRRADGDPGCVPRSRPHRIRHDSLHPQPLGVALYISSGAWHFHGYGCDRHLVGLPCIGRDRLCCRCGVDAVWPLAATAGRSWPRQAHRCRLSGHLTQDGGHLPQDG